VEVRVLSAAPAPDELRSKKIQRIKRLREILARLSSQQDHPNVQTISGDPVLGAGWLGIELDALRRLSDLP
jgi:hypothetical protein